MQVPCNVELGHEFRYRDSIPNARQLVVTISQSGETLDTMEALKRARQLGHEATLSICNVRESAIPRASKLVFYTRAGTEIGVASTKAFTTQLVALFTLALAVANVVIIAAVAAGSVTLNVQGQTLTVSLPAGLTLPALLIGQTVTVNLSLAGGDNQGDDDQGDDDNGDNSGDNGGGGGGD